MCLPVFPRFYQGLKASRLGTSLRSLLHEKSEANLNLGIQSGVRNAATGHIRSGFRKYRFLTDEFPTSQNGSSGQDMPNEHSLGGLSTNQILRTTQIVTTSDRDSESVSHPGIGVHSV